jgi:hypothetical protein
MGSLASYVQLLSIKFLIFGVSSLCPGLLALHGRNAGS